MIGETSLALATACFGDGMTGNNGYSGEDVLYIAFTGSDAVPGTSADWKANNYTQFEASIIDLGNTLIERIGSSGGSGSSCTWPGHCAGASCSSDNDCSGSLTCNNGVCG